MRRIGRRYEGSEKEEGRQGMKSKKTESLPLNSMLGLKNQSTLPLKESGCLLLDRLGSKRLVLGTGAKAGGIFGQVSKSSI